MSFFEQNEVIEDGVDKKDTKFEDNDDNEYTSKI